MTSKSQTFIYKENFYQMIHLCVFNSIDSATYKFL